MLGAASDVWRFQPHPEVWVLIIGLLAMGWYVARVLGPQVVADTDTVVTRNQTRWFFGAIALLWIVSDWPIHDLSEEYLYWVHMVQHLVITFVIPPMVLLATPEWLARLIVSSDGSSGVWIRRLAHPIVAGLLFNAVVAVTHAPVVVNFSVENGPFHYALHVTVFMTALLMWVPVAGPLPELRISLPAQMIYLFLMSVIPTIPGGWLTFADSAVYSAYDHDVRLWGTTVIRDQQAAGMIMKVVGGFYLWSIIAVLFFRWSNTSSDEHRKMRRVDSAEILTYDEVSSAFAESGPAPVEPSPETDAP